MLSRSEIALLKADIAVLEKAHNECNDERIKKVIQGWIAEQKNKLAES